MKNLDGFFTIAVALVICAWILQPKPLPPAARYQIWWPNGTDASTPIKFDTQTGRAWIYMPAPYFQWVEFSSKFIPPPKSSILKTNTFNWEQATNRSAPTFLQQ